MKSKLLSVALMIFFQVAHAGYEICDQSVSDNKNVSRDLDNLRRLNGVTQLNHCSVEIHICAPAATLNNQVNGQLHGDGIDNIVGDVLVRNKSGRSIYVPIYYTTENSQNLELQWSATSTEFKYRFKDLNMVSLSGTKETNALFISLDKNGALQEVQAKVFSDEFNTNILNILHLSKSVHCER